MKRSLLFLLLSVALFSCSKKDSEEDDDDPSKTLITITNTTNSLSGIMVGSWNGDGNQAKLIKNIGTLNTGSSSGEIEIKDHSLNRVFIYFTQNSKTYAISTGYLIAQGTTTNLFIDGSFTTIEIDESDQLYPK